MEQNISTFQDRKSFLLIPVFTEMESPYMRYIVPTLTLIGILGNLAALVKIVMDKRLHTPTYIVVAALIVSDLCGLGCHVIHQMLHLSGEMDSKEAGWIFMTLSYGTTHSSASHVVFLLGLRYYSVVWPIKYDHLNLKVVIKLSCVLWIISICFAGLYYFLRFETEASLPVVVLLFRCYLLCLPIVFITYFHYRKITVLKKCALEVKSESDLHERRRTRRIKRQIHVMSKMILIILLVFTVSAALYPIAFCLVNFEVCRTENECQGIIFTARIAWLVKYSVNPVIYLLFSEPVYSRIKPSVIKFFKIHCEETKL
jgi:hypothetical protein